MTTREETQHLSGRRAALLALSVAASFCWPTKPLWAESLPSVTIGKAVDTIPFTVIDVALAEGFFTKNGINAKEVLVQGSSAANAAMMGGSLQFACEAADPLMLAQSHGVPVMAVDSLDNGVGLQLIVSTKWLAKHPLPTNATFEQKMASLNGAVFSEVSTTQQAFYGLLRGWAGLPKLTGYRLENLGSMAAVTAAIQKNVVDVTIQSPPHSIEMIEQGSGKDLVDRQDVPQFNNVAYDILTTTSSYAEHHPKITSAVATSIAQALNFMREHPNETLAIEEKHFPNLGKRVLQQSLQFIPFTKDGLQSQESWNRAVALAQQTGLIHGVTKAPEGVYWTNKYIEKAKLAE